MPASNLKELTAWINKSGKAAAVPARVARHERHPFQKATPHDPIAATEIDASDEGSIDVLSKRRRFPWRSQVRACQSLRRRRQKRLACARYSDKGRGRPAGIDFAFWHAFWVPKGTPEEMVANLTGALRSTGSREMRRSYPQPGSSARSASPEANAKPGEEIDKTSPVQSGRYQGA